MGSEVIKCTFQALGSRCEIVLDTAHEDLAEECFLLAKSEVERIEKKYSRFREDSVVSIINAAAGKTSIFCDDETCELIRFGQSLYEVSGGLFDMTAGLLSRAWDFRSAKIPTTAEIDYFRGLVGWSKVKWDGRHISLPLVGMHIDFGGFGKEYAVDRVSTLLRARGITSGYVNFGGDIAVMGPRSDQSPWLLGIQDPRKSGQVVATIPVFIGALASSGDYERFFEIAGKRYCHVIHPQTGHPVSYWRSVTVLASQVVIAGGYTTIAMLMERDGLDFLQASGLEFLAIDQQGSVYRNEAKAK